MGPTLARRNNLDSRIYHVNGSGEPVFAVDFMHNDMAYCLHPVEPKTRFPALAFVS
jgi:hypothetical protein